MPVPDRTTLPTRLENLLVQITDDGSRTLLRNDTGDAYHSASGAIAETRHVYLINSGIAQRLSERRQTDLLELGLGTGMALLMSIDAAIRGDAQLHYVAVENDWLPADVLEMLEPESWVSDAQIAESFLSFRASLPECVEPGEYSWSVDAKRRATIIVGDINTQELPGNQFDAIYFDPFAPASQPNLWGVELLVRMADSLKPGGKLVTYCVNRSVREAVEAAGLQVQRVRGPVGGKREVLIATKVA